MVAAALHDKKYDLIVASELMLRQYFGRQAAKTGVKKAQDQLTRLILKFIGGDSAESEFVRSEIQLHSDRGVSPIWLSDEFTLPLFALVAENYCNLLSPTGKGFIRAEIEADDESFFGAKLKTITSAYDDQAHEYQFNLYALAGTKAYLETEAGMRNAHDLVTRRLAEMQQGTWA